MNSKFLIPNATLQNSDSNSKLRNQNHPRGLQIWNLKCGIQDFVFRVCEFRYLIAQFGIRNLPFETWNCEFRIWNSEKKRFEIVLKTSKEWGQGATEGQLLWAVPVSVVFGFNSKDNFKQYSKAFR